MRAISEVFERARKDHRLVLIGYLPAGYPDEDSFVELATIAFSAGLDILEIGLPAADPQYDGPVIRSAIQQVYQRGITPQTAFAFSGRALQEANGSAILMFYAEILKQFTPETIFEGCWQAGIDGVLPVGMAMDEWLGLAAAARLRKIAPIGFLSAAMDQFEMRQVIVAAEGFLYLQSQEGPTGQPREFGKEVAGRIIQVRKALNHSLPVVVGFGVRQPADVQRIRQLGADGVVVGTAFVEAAQQGRAALEDFVAQLSQAAMIPV